MIPLTDYSISIVARPIAWTGTCLGIPGHAEDLTGNTDPVSVRLYAKRRVSFYTKEAWKRLNYFLYTINRPVDVVELVTGVDVDVQTLRSDLPFYHPFFELNTIEYSRMRVSDAARAFTFWREPDLMDTTVSNCLPWIKPVWHTDLGAMTSLYWSLWLKTLSIGDQL